MLQTALAFATIILLSISLREIEFHMEHSHQPCSLLLFSSNQFRNECEGVRSQPVFLKDFGVYEKNRSTSAKH